MDDLSPIGDINDPSYQADTPDSQIEPESDESDDVVEIIVPEAATRKLAGLPNDVAKRILQEAMADAAANNKTRVTAKAVGVLADEWKTDNLTEPIKKPKSRQPKVPKDKDGTEIPERLTDAFERGARLSVIVKQALPNIASELYAFHDWLYDGERDNRKLPKWNGAFSIKAIQPHLDALTELIEANAPNIVCKKCGGDGGSCCRGRGWSS